MKPKHFTIAVFIPELSCPFQCVYCNQRKITGKLSVPSSEEVKQFIHSHLKTLPAENTIIELGFFGGNFTGIPMQVQEKFLKTVQPFIKEGRINAIRLSTRPDYINNEKLDLLQKFNVSTIELGAQSMDEEVLKKSKRGHTSMDTIISSGLIKSYGFRLGLQMMIGLPGDTFQKSFNTAMKITELGAEDTRIYPCLVIKGTGLEEWYNKGKYKPLSLPDAVQWSKEIFKYFESNGVNVIRMGLHPSEGLLSGEELIAGPFHQSFKELVLTEIWTDHLRPLSFSTSFEKIKILVPPMEINYAIGYGSKNKKYLQQHFKSVRFLPDLNLQAREFKVVSDSY